MENILQGIVINKIDYQDNDEVITILTLNGPLSFIARGTRKIESKNRVALQLLNMVECEMFLARVKNKVSKLKKAVLIKQYNFLKADFDVTNILLKIANIIKHNSYDFVKNIFLIVDKFGWGNDYSLLAYLLFSSLECFGIKPYMKGCVECKAQTKLIEFNFYKGGFLCIDHADATMDIKYLETIFLLSQSIDMYEQKASLKYSRKIVKELVELIKESNYI
ncbi:DNA repair protein RecO [Mycoplasma phocoenae]|uniref:DNA repair protein RecO n=1 Tax=Mycoplasma phocoenae TaxID=754517 RepID=A0A858U635_9MOLU|nr:DNA repair protein RecO [Mycoplasma phocoenae]QJG66725.1 DNA repair protein RecO [Mycoplasma phocoenae]